MKQLKTICVVLALAMTAVVANANTIPYITFEGYKSGEGAPPGPVGGAIGSSATGPQEPFYGSYAYWYMDGWNHAPRVDPAQYSGLWAPGGHAGTGTVAQGWNSLDNANPGYYVFDFEGYVFDSTSYDTDEESPTYMHEYRQYDGTGGIWTIIDISGGETGVIVGGGTLGTMLMDIYYGTGPYIMATGTVTATDDGGAFYNELMTRWGTPLLTYTLYCGEPPIQAENLGADLDQQWAIYGCGMTLMPVPEPTTVCLLGLGCLALIRKRRSA